MIKKVSIEEATYWIAYPDENSPVKDYIIPNKKYPLIRVKNVDDEEDVFIKSEDGNLSLYYLNHNGDFIKENKD